LRQEPANDSEQQGKGETGSAILRSNARGIDQSSARSIFCIEIDTLQTIYTSCRLHWLTRHIFFCDV